jgi:aminoglycoside phosphotransferase (APT) family kinase protein
VVIRTWQDEAENGTVWDHPFSLLHTDLRRDNVFVSCDGDPTLICVDWELATYGDPLHDEAKHLVGTPYADYQRSDVEGIQGHGPVRGAGRAHIGREEPAAAATSPPGLQQREPSWM